MARTTIVQITDDLDGSADAQEVAFSFQGADYTIDLGKKNLAALEKALQPYIDAATKTTSTSRRTAKKSAARPTARSTTTSSTTSSTKSATRSGRGGRSRSSRSAGRDLQAIREWAKAQGIEVSDRGRISQAVLDRYDQAHTS